MRILFISSQFPNCVQPDLGIFSLQIVRELARSSDIKVIAPVPSIGPLTFMDRFKKYKTDLNIPSEEQIEGITVYHPRYFALPGMGFLHHMAMRSVIQPLIETINSEWEIDVVNCHWLFPDGVASQRVCKKLGIPVMLTALGCDLNSYTNLLTRKYTIQNTLIDSDKVSVLNRSMLETCVALGVPHTNISIIPNGVDLGTFKMLDRGECRKKLGISAADKMVLFVGSLVEVKNVDNLIRAFKLISDSNENMKLVLVGSGYLHNDLQQLTQSLGIDRFITFVGQVNHEKLVDWMNAADCLCLPSLREGHPNVMMEALSCGIPVVASLTGSIPDFINNDNGLVIQHPHHYTEIAEKLYSCLTSEYDRDKVRRSVSDYSWSSCAHSYLNELRNCKNGTSVPVC